MAFKPQQKLQVLRTLSTGQQIPVGVLAQNRQGVFFQYDEAYLQTDGNLSPFHLTYGRELQLAPKTPHAGLHGVFADALPDGWVWLGIIAARPGIPPAWPIACATQCHGSAGLCRPYGDWRAGV